MGRTSTSKWETNGESMYLNRKRIIELINTEKLKIEPLDLDFQLKGNSLDVRLSNEYFKFPDYLEPELSMLDPMNPYLNILERDRFTSSGMVLEKNKIYLFETIEEFFIPEGYSLFLQNKFRITQLGVNILNIGIIEGGFEGKINILLKNSGNLPVRIYPEMFIAHVFFFETV
ncbi:dCTP deaminase [Persephonella sp.]